MPCQYGKRDFADAVKINILRWDIIQMGEIKSQMSLYVVSGNDGSIASEYVTTMMALKMEKEATNKGMQAASRSWWNQGDILP